MQNTKKALVTGGTKGIGQAIAEELKKHDYEVWITGTSEQKPSGEFQYFKVDFSRPDEVDAFLSKVTTIPFSVLVNNASTTKIANLVDLSKEDFARIQDINMLVPCLLQKHVLKNMLSNQYGRILNITSVFSQVSRSGRTAYSASKAALTGMTRALALEVAKHGVVVNCLAPGFVMTELVKKSLGECGIEEVITKIPMGRLAVPSEIAKYAYFLLSEQNTYMTGQTLTVDGGFTCE